VALDTVDISTAARLLGVSERHVRRLCRKGRLPGAIKRGCDWDIPRDADPKIATVKSPEKLSAEIDLAAIPVPKRDVALQKAGLVELCEKFCGEAVRNNICCRTVALGRFADDHGVAVRSLQRWMADWRRKGLAGLLDGRGGAKNDAIISPDAWAEFKAQYLTKQQRSVKLCWQNICYLNKSQNRGWIIPPLRTMQRYTGEKIPSPMLIWAREGQAAYEAKCAPYIETDMNSIEPGAVWIGDHHQFDCWIRYRDTWIRPWITAWEDMRSRSLVGWIITPQPNSSTILQAFRRAAEKYGPPDAVKIDNGRDYDSETFTGTTKVKRRLDLRVDEETTAGLYALLNITISFAIPYHAQSKAIERWFDTIEGQFVKTIPTYCGKDTARRPEELNDYLKTDRAVMAAMSLEDFAGTAGQYVEIYNHTAHSGRGMKGRCPADVLAGRQSRRVLADGVLDLLCRVWSGVQTVGKNGVRVKGLWYGQFDTALMMYQGRDVRIAYNPDDISRVWVYEANTYKLVAVAEQAQMLAYGAGADETALREAMAAKTRAKKIVRQFAPASRTANTDITSLTLAAMADRQQKPPQENNATLRPVATVMDGQVRQHQRQLKMKAVRRAAGAEEIKSVPDFEFDFTSQTTSPPERFEFDFVKGKTDLKKLEFDL